MTNTQIILTEMQLHGITEEVHTYAVWKSKGYQVQRGQHALFTTKVWKKVRKTSKDGEEYDKMIMTNAAFFGESQVAEIEVA